MGMHIGSSTTSVEDITYFREPTVAVEVVEEDDFIQGNHSTMDICTVPVTKLSPSLYYADVESKSVHMVIKY